MERSSADPSRPRAGGDPMRPGCPRMRRLAADQGRPAGPAVRGAPPPAPAPRRTGRPAAVTTASRSMPLGTIRGSAGHLLDHRRRRCPLTRPGCTPCSSDRERRTAELTGLDRAGADEVIGLCRAGEVVAQGIAHAGCDALAGSTRSSGVPKATSSRGVARAAGVRRRPERGDAGTAHREVARRRHAGDSAPRSARTPGPSTRRSAGTEDGEQGGQNDERADGAIRTTPIPAYAKERRK